MSDINSNTVPSTVSPGTKLGSLALVLLLSVLLGRALGCLGGAPAPVVLDASNAIVDTSSAAGAASTGTIADVAADAVD